MFESIDSTRSIRSMPLGSMGTNWKYALVRETRTYGSIRRKSKAYEKDTLGVGFVDTKSWIRRMGDRMDSKDLGTMFVSIVLESIDTKEMNEWIRTEHEEWIRAEVRSMIKSVKYAQLMGRNVQRGDKDGVDPFNSEHKTDRNEGGASRHREDTLNRVETIDSKEPSRWRSIRRDISAKYPTLNRS